jgi:SAM-dependent methyltransferase
VRSAVRDELLRINRAFYQSLAEPFAATRRRPQPGVQRLLRRIDHGATVLDVGCGHGLAAALLARLGHQGTYCGVDASQPLIDLARRGVAARWASFVTADITQPGWRRAAPLPTFDWVLGFAVLHHIPDAVVRLRLAEEVRSALPAGGRAAVSVWDFAGSERFRRRIVAWGEVGLTAADVEPGDVLLDWRHAGRGVRYVHHFSAVELTALARQAGFAVTEEFRSDGEAGSLGLYQVWEA